MFAVEGDRIIKPHNYVKIISLDFRTICNFLTVLATQEGSFEITINILQMGYIGKQMHGVLGGIY